MPRGDKRNDTSKQRRQARHTEDSERKRGQSPQRAKQIGNATVEKQDGGAKPSGRGRGKARKAASSASGGRRG